jgi:hypothetical protein
MFTFPTMRHGPYTGGGYLLNRLVRRMYPTCFATATVFFVCAVRHDCGVSQPRELMFRLNLVESYRLYFLAVIMFSSQFTECIGILSLTLQLFTV